jgi:hypothetical protein
MPVENGPAGTRVIDFVLHLDRPDFATTYEAVAASAPVSLVNAADNRRNGPVQADSYLLMQQLPERTVRHMPVCGP